jgi:hypothetical protein
MITTFFWKLKTPWRPLAPVALLACQWQMPTLASAQTQVSRQHFVCHIGYTQQQCDFDMGVLRRALSKYPVEALGEWTWVLVGSEDWKCILLARGFSPDRGPAFSILAQRETFFETALVRKVSSRGFQLSRLWRMSIEDLLDLAVRHELAHALCNESNESHANRSAIALKQGKPLSCQTTLMTKNHASETPKER